jgi:hypothetical protein
MLPKIGSFQGPGGRFEVMLSLLLLVMNLFVTYKIKNIKRVRLKRMGKFSSIWKGNCCWTNEDIAHSKNIILYTGDLK